MEIRIFVIVCTLLLSLIDTGELPNAFINWKMFVSKIEKALNGLFIFY